MNCPECNNKTGVTETRKMLGNIYRIRRCKKCNKKFYTVEKVIANGFPQPRIR